MHLEDSTNLISETSLQFYSYFFHQLLCKTKYVNLSYTKLRYNKEVIVSKKITWKEIYNDF